MLKLNASYSKKVPAEGEYTSQSYHASVEVELSDGLTTEQLQDKIHETFEIVRNSVEAELHHYGASYAATSPRNNAPKHPHQTNRSGDTQDTIPASPKQLSYLLDLARVRGITPQQIAGRFQISNVQQLTRKQCSDLINEWRAA